MLMLSSFQFSRSPRRGFTLTEMAIVLGIFGAIIAAITAASSGTRSSIRANQVTDQLGVIVDNVRSYYSSRGYPSGLVSCANVFTGTNPMAASTGIFPLDVIDSVNKGDVKVGLCLDAPAPPQIVVRYAAIPHNYCHRVVIAASSSGLGMKLSKTVLNNAAASTFFVPLVGFLSTSSNLDVDKASGAILPSSPNLAAGCSAAPFVNVDWYYNFSS